MVLLGAAFGFFSGSHAVVASQHPAQSTYAPAAIPLPSPEETIHAEMMADAKDCATAEPAARQFAYVAAKGGATFHLPGCASAKRIKPENLVGFGDRREAEATGRRACKRCLP
jgi:hypothetical protein